MELSDGGLGLLYDCGGLIERFVQQSHSCFEYMAGLNFLTLVCMLLFED